MKKAGFVNVTVTSVANEHPTIQHVLVPAYNLKVNNGSADFKDTLLITDKQLVYGSMASLSAVVENHKRNSVVAPPATPPTDSMQSSCHKNCLEDDSTNWEDYDNIITLLQDCIDDLDSNAKQEQMNSNNNHHKQTLV